MDKEESPTPSLTFTQLSDKNLVSVNQSFGYSTSLYSWVPPVLSPSLPSPCKSIELIKEVLAMRNKHLNVNVCNLFLFVVSYLHQNEAACRSVYGDNPAGWYRRPRAILHHEPELSAKVPYTPAGAAVGSLYFITGKADFTIAEPDASIVRAAWFHTTGF